MKRGGWYDILCIVLMCLMRNRKCPNSTGYESNKYDESNSPMNKKWTEFGWIHLSSGCMVVRD